MHSTDLLFTIIGVSLFAIVGFLVFAIMAGVLLSSRTDEVSALETEYGARSILRRNKMMEILKQIGGPQNKDGTFTDEQNRLWKIYKELEAQDRQITRAERNHIIRVHGYITDEEQAELDAGINPYIRR